MIPPLFRLRHSQRRSRTTAITEASGAQRWATAHELIRRTVAGGIGAGALLGVALVAPATQRGAALAGVMAAVGVTATGLRRFWDVVGFGPGSSGNREGGGGTLGPS